jgi:hypothetical protein
MNRGARADSSWRDAGRSVQSRSAMTTGSPDASHGGLRRAALLVGAVLTLGAFHLAGILLLDGFRLDLGSLNTPTPQYLVLVAFWTPFGALAAALFALALAWPRAPSSSTGRLAAEWAALSDRRFLLWACFAAVVIPVAIRRWVLHGAPIADDEAAYRFGAELLARGRLWVQSPPLKLFFDQNHMINDGRLYPVYFLGWPALMAPGVWMGAPGLMNPLMSSLTVPPLFRAIDSFVGPRWARAGVLLFLSSPFLQVAAATLLSHTSCLMALTWCLWMYVRATSARASVRDHAGFALAFAVAFCIRPQSGVPIGLPLLAAWALTVARLERRRRVRAVLAFAVPSVAIAALFLGSLWAQNGSPWRVGYSRYAEYMLENNFRFTTYRSIDLTTVPGYDFSELGLAVARTAAGLFRLNADLFGWPSSMALLVFAVPLFATRIRILWAMFASYLLLQFFQRDWGIDTFGPVHAFEIALPVIVLTIAGVKNLSDRMIWQGAGHALGPGASWSAFAPSLLAALIVTAWLGFVPLRLEGVRQIAAHLNTALNAPARAGIGRAIVFAPFPFAPRCDGIPRHFVLFRPVNDPDLANDILWVNHVSLEDDRRLIERLGDRPGYLMQWTSKCDVALTRITNDAAPGTSVR